MDKNTHRTLNRYPNLPSKRPTATMVNLNIVEDRPTPKSVYNWRVYFSASVAAFAAVMIGYVSES